MSEDRRGVNYDLAKAEAEKVDAQIIETLQAGRSFVLRLAPVLVRLTH